MKLTTEFINLNVDIRKYIESRFKPKVINKNDNVYSFDYDNFQIDLILIDESKWNIAQVYYSYDPLGNAMGKTFHKFNLSYGWNGLYYKFRNFNGRNSKNMLLTTNVEKIFDFGGYNYKRYGYGFDTLEEIFEFVIKGKYFDSQMFKMENLNSIDKKRNRKRGSYHIFLKYIDENDINIVYPFEKDKEKYLSLIDNAFPEAKFLEKLEKLRDIDEINKLVVNKFNGNLVMTWFPNLKGKELGNAITKFKNSLGDNYNKFILISEENTIRTHFEAVNNNI